MLEDDERAELTRGLRSAGIAVGPWKTPARSGRTYAALRLPPEGGGGALERLGARVHEPALTVLEIVPDSLARLHALAETLGGAGAPAGVVDCLALPAAVLVELDETRTPLATVADLVDIELEHAPGRRILPVLGLSDERLAAFASALLGDPGLDASRLIETYLEAPPAALRRG